MMLYALLEQAISMQVIAISLGFPLSSLQPATRIRAWECVYGVFVYMCYSFLFPSPIHGKEVCECAMRHAFVPSASTTACHSAIYR